jgi:hypothetical protein
MGMAVLGSDVFRPFVNHIEMRDPDERTRDIVACKPSVLMSYTHE